MRRREFLAGATAATLAATTAAARPSERRVETLLAELTAAMEEEFGAPCWVHLDREAKMVAISAVVGGAK